MQPFYRTASLTVDTSRHQKLFEDPDHTGLDDNLLDHSAVDSGLELSPPMHDSRRESFAVGSVLFSPKTEDWQSVDMQSLPSNNPFVDTTHTSNNPFFRADNTHQHFVSQTNPWSMDHAPNSAIQPFDGIGDYDTNGSIFQRAMHVPTPFAPAGNIFGALGGHDQSIPGSPQKDWMGQAMNKKMRPSSPAIRSHNDLRRGDGIRKKNARFDIPAERNLSNIDHLIAQSTDEQEIKELKQQKRLLRNRQAALDSRQRKKLHTERLEDEKKHFTVMMADLEDEIVNLRARIDSLVLEKDSYATYVDALTHEKDEMIRIHTIETGELRKKVSVLTEHIQRYESNATPNAASNGVFSGNSYDEMEGMGMGASWDDNNHGFINDYATEAETVRPEMAIVPARKTETVAVDGEKSASQGGLLFMLFLVGAFVMSSRSAPPALTVSEDVRQASAALLDNVLKDAGINSQPSGVRAMAPQPSGTTWAEPSVPSMQVNSMNVDSVMPSMLQELGDSLTRPTEEQSNEQIFSMSAAQYNGVNDQQFLQNAPERSTSQGRKNLAEALAAMRANNKQNGAADVYTRSLLWDQIPSEVVRNFAKMVSECNSQNQQQCNEAQL